MSPFRFQLETRGLSLYFQPVPQHTPSNPAWILSNIFYTQITVWPFLYLRDGLPAAKIDVKDRFFYFVKRPAACSRELHSCDFIFCSIKTATAINISKSSLLLGFVFFISTLNSEVVFFPPPKTPSNISFAKFL